MSEFIELTFFLNGHTYITDSFVCPGEKLIYFFKINPLKTDTG